MNHHIGPSPKIRWSKSQLSPSQYLKTLTDTLSLQINCSVFLTWCTKPFVCRTWLSALTFPSFLVYTFVFVYSVLFSDHLNSVCSCFWACLLIGFVCLSFNNKLHIAFSLSQWHEQIMCSKYLQIWVQIEDAILIFFCPQR